MDTKKNQFTLLGLFRRFFLIVLVLALTYSSIMLLFPGKAYAAVDGVFIDKTAIRVGQDIYRDSNPFDGTYRWSLELGSECSNSISISDRAFDSGNTNMTAPIVTKINLSRIFNNDCQSNGEDTITITQPARRLIMGYRIDTRTIFMPVWYAGGPELNGNYRATQDGDTEYLRNGDNYDDGGTRVNYTSGDRAQYEELRCGFAGCTTQFQYDFTLANGGSFATADATAYPGAPKTSNPTDPGALDPGDSSNPTTPGGGTSQQSCEDADDFAWVGCPFIRGIDGVLRSIEANVVDILVIKPEAYEGNGIKDAWVVFRNISSILLIIVMLVVVISTALGFSFVDAYTVKKILPRLVIAVIFIQLSWALTTFSINFINVIGNGIFGIMLTPFGGADATNLPSLIAGADGGQGLFNTLIIAGLAAGGIALGFLGLLSLAFTTFLAVFVGFIILIIRNLVIILTIMLAPIAIVAWIMPGTNKVWSLWWDSFSKALLMFPFIMMLFAAGRIMAWTTVQAEVATAGGIGPGFLESISGSVLTVLIVVAAYVIPYFLIPFTLKFAGGLVGTLGGLANDRSRGIFDRSKKYRAAKASDNWQKTKSFNRFNDRGLGSVANKALGIGANPIATRGGITRSGRNKARSLASSRGAMIAAEELKNDAVYQANQNDDKFLLALGDKELAQKKMAGTSGTERAAWETALASASQVKSRNSNDTRLAALNGLAATGYQFSAGQKGYNELAESMAKVTGAQLTRDTEGNVVGATGSGAGAYANAMNSAQYNLKNAGRFDLAGINNGSGYSYRAGIDKSSGYTAGNAKKETHIAGAESMLGSEFVSNGKTIELQDTIDGTTGQVLKKGFATTFRDGVLNGTIKAEDVQVHHRNLRDAYQSATGANKTEIGKQLQAIEGFASSVTPDSAYASPEQATRAGAILQTIQENNREARRGIDPNLIENS